MYDPRLNSIHLEMPRRQDFRAARDVLLGARGCQTVALESPPELDHSLDHPRVDPLEPDAVPGFQAAD